MPQYTTEDYADMYTLYSSNDFNAEEAARVYADKYPRRNQPSPGTILRVANRFNTTGSVVLDRSEIGGPTPRLRDEVEDDVLDHFINNPESSISIAAAELEISKSTVRRILISMNLHPFKKTRVQELLPADYAPRVDFCEWITNQETASQPSSFIKNILFTDECTFRNVGCYNHQNFHYWSEFNPHMIDDRRSIQSRFKINLWLGVYNNKLIGPHRFTGNLTGETYNEFITQTLPRLCDDAGIPRSQQHWFQQDGAPAHTSRVARSSLDQLYPARWIGKYGPVLWPPRSPDLNPLDYFVWGHIKNIVYKTPVRTEQELEEKINEAIATISPEMIERGVENLMKRARACIRNEGRQFENDLRSSTRINNTASNPNDNGESNDSSSSEGENTNDSSGSDWQP